LAAIDPTGLNGHDLVELAPAYVKLISHLQAKLATVLNLIQHSPPGGADAPPERSELPHGWAQVEIAARLHWTAGKAGYELRLAHHLRRLPAVHAALVDGVIDLPRARLFVDTLSCLEDEAAGQVAQRVIAAGAGGWNTRRLSGRLRRAVIAQDPAAASRRLALRVADRWVQADPTPDGTAHLSGMHLPPQRVHTIMERITAIATTAKQHGDPRTVLQLQADTFCDLLAGTGIGANPPGPVTDPQAPPGGPADGRGEVVLPSPRRGVVELTASLSTLVGLSQAPGTLAGWGPVVADVVRQLVAEQPQARWRFSVYDDLGGGGQLVCHGITTARPRPTGGTGSGRGFSAGDGAFLRARDRTCRGPQGCHRPASGCELDHTVAKVDGGGHERSNGGALCKREHMFKHQSGAVLHQPEPGVFQWTTPLGHSYTIKPEPYEESTGPPDP
jgi:Domain of unknown function (DUF222)